MKPAWMPGDIFACWGTDRLSRMISWQTSSFFGPSGLRFAPSHVAICVHQGSIGPLWIESTTLSKSPCLIQQKCVSGCQAHLIDERMADYRNAGGRVEVYRLTPADTLSNEQSGLLCDMLLRYYVRRGVRYDKGEAIISGTHVFKRTRFLPPESLDTMFCSKLVAKALMRLHLLNRTNATKYDPGSLMRELVNDGTYARVPDPNLPADEGPQLRIYRGEEKSAA